MEEVMTAETNQTTLQTWWDELSFAGKELFYINEHGELIMRPLHQYKERAIATVTPENAEVLLKALKEKFPEVETRAKEVEAEWVTADDKLKMIGKVERLKDYLLHTNALGDFDRLFNIIADWEKTLNELIEENYNARLKLVAMAEELADSENMKEATQAIRDITEQWKKIGYLDKKRNDELWARLEEAKNKFFARKRNNQEEHEKEMLQNLDMKMELVEKAEALALSEKWKETSEVFRKLMEEWKTIGRTVNEKNEELWNRFINAKNTFYDRKKIHFDTIQKEQEANYQLKLNVVERAEALKESTNWAGTAQAFADMMEEWKNIGRVPAEKADELWARFIAAKEYFFNAKRQNQESFKISLEDNLARKMALLKRAESLKNSAKWHETTDELNEMMVEWKKIGPVPREHSNAIWEQFLDARKYFFKRKDENRDRRKQYIESESNRRLNQATSFLQKLQEELKEEQDKLDDFRVSLENVTPGRKEHELRAHLQKLISQTEVSIKRKEEKISDVQHQLEELNQKNAKPKNKIEEKSERTMQHDNSAADNMSAETSNSSASGNEATDNAAGDDNAS